MKMTKDIVLEVPRSEVENMEIGEIGEGINIGEEMNSVEDYIGEVDSAVEIESVDGFFDAMGKMVHNAVKNTIHVAKFVVTHSPPVVAAKVAKAVTKPVVKHGVVLARLIAKNPTPIGIAKAIYHTQRAMAKDVIKRAVHRKVRKYYSHFRRRGVSSRHALLLAKKVVKKRYYPKYKKAYHYWIKHATHIAKRVHILLKRNPLLIRKVIPHARIPVIKRPPIRHIPVVRRPVHLPPKHVPTYRHVIRRRRIPVKTSHIIHLFPPQTRYGLRILKLRYQTAKTPEEKKRIHFIAKKFFGHMLVDFVKKPEDFSNKFARMKREKWIHYAYKHAPTHVKKAFVHALKKLKKAEMIKNRRIAREKILLNLLKRGKITYEQYMRLRNRYKYSRYLHYVPKKDLHKIYLETLKKKQMTLAQKRAMLQYKRRLEDMKKRIQMEKEKLKQEKLKALLRMKKLEQHRRLLQRKIDYWKKKMAIKSMRERAKYYQNLYKQKQKYLELERKKLQKELDVKRKQYIQMLKGEIAKLKKEKERILKELEDTRKEIAKMKMEKHKTPAKYIHPTAVNVVKHIIYTIGENGVSEEANDVESINLSAEEEE